MRKILKPIALVLALLTLAAVLYSCGKKTETQTVEDWDFEEEENTNADEPEDYGDTEGYTNNETLDWDDEPVPEETPEAISFMRATAFTSPGIAIVEDENETAYLIDKSGKILYEQADVEDMYNVKGTEKLYFNSRPIPRRAYDCSNGIAYIGKNILNSKGKVIATPEKNGYTKVVGVANGYALVLKYESGIEGVKYTYWFIDENGNKVGSNIIPSEDQWFQEYYHIRYLNSDMYALYYHLGQMNFLVYNLRTKKLINIDNKGFFSDEENVDFSSGYTYYTLWGEFYKVDVSGKVSKTSEFDKFLGKYLLTMSKDKTEIVIEDLMNNKKSVYTEHASMALINGAYVCDDGIVMPIRGKDGAYYFTVIANGKEVFEPINGSLSSDLRGHDVIVYSSASVYKIVDLHGKALAESIERPQTVGENLIAVYANKLYCYIDYTGKVVLESIHH